MDHVHFGIPSLLSERYAAEVVGSLAGTQVLVSIWCLVSTLEWARNIDLFRESGLLSWRILSLRPGLILRSERAQALFWDRSIVFVLGLRIVAAAVLLATTNAIAACIALIAIVATSWFLTVRTWLGEDGADQMGQIVAIGALVVGVGVASHQSALSFAGTLLIGGHLFIAYFFSGYSKLKSAEWRRGQALVGVMGTHSYGHPLGAHIASGSPTFSLCFCWLVIVGETLFPLILFAPHAVAVAVLGAFFLFHVANAWFMGLNTFIWPFAAAYPSVVVLNDLVTQALLR